MKNLVLIISILFLNQACNRADEPLKIIDLSVQNIAGTWKLTEAYVSPGGETTWQPVEGGIEYVFKTDATFQASGGNCQSGSFDLDLEAERLTLNCANESGNSQQTFRVLKLTAFEMEISYPGCIEACIYRYTKQ
ncbi:hypothetical protein E0K83_10405 [Gramella sp. BOM4]|nr:hypothetical protein [Christiangramia bathymodioli]